MGRSPTRRTTGKSSPVKPVEAAKAKTASPDVKTAPTAKAETPKAVSSTTAAAPAKPKTAIAPQPEKPKAPVPAPAAKPAAAATPAAPAASAAPTLLFEEPVPKSVAPDVVADKPAAKPVIEAVVPVASVAPPSKEAEAVAKAEPLKAAIETAAKASQESTKMVDTVTDKAKTAFNDVSEQARVALEKGTKVIEELNDFTKGNVEAFVAAGRAAAKGAETLGQNAAEFSRKSFEEATKAVKTISTAKSPTEFFKFQNDFAKTQFDALIAEATKVSETFVKIFGEVTEPLSSRAAVAADKLKTAIK